MSKTYDPFDNDYELFYYNDQNVSTGKFFDIGIRIIEEYGRTESQVPMYNVTRTNLGERFYSAITGRKELDKCLWLKNREKWDLTYQIGFQVLEGDEDKHWWRITRKIIGTRSSREPRSFEASDFKKTQEIFDGLQREMSNEFRTFKDSATSQKS